MDRRGPGRGRGLDHRRRGAFDRLQLVDHLLALERRVEQRGRLAALDQLLDELDTTLLAIRGVAATRMGEVTVACVPSTVHYYLSQVILRYRESHPKVRVKVMDSGANEVLDAAGTKWNFLKFRPGLVGGHCIGVDPYYLTHKADMLGYHPQVILAGRRINDGMGKFIAQRTVKEMIHAGHNILGATVTVFGLTFKEDCPDLRNSKVIDIIRELEDYGIDLQVCDPLADPAEAMEEYGVALTPFDELRKSQAVVIAVAHREYAVLSPENLLAMMTGSPLVIDVKGIYDRQLLESNNIRVWRL